MTAFIGSTFFMLYWLPRFSCYYLEPFLLFVCFVRYILRHFTANNHFVLKLLHGIGIFVDVVCDFLIFRCLCLCRILFLQIKSMLLYNLLSKYFSIFFSRIRLSLSKELTQMTVGDLLVLVFSLLLMLIAFLWLVKYFNLAELLPQQPRKITISNFPLANNEISSGIDPNTIVKNSRKFSNLDNDLLAKIIRNFKENAASRTETNQVKLYQLAGFTSYAEWALSMAGWLIITAALDYWFELGIYFKRSGGGPGSVPPFE